MWDGRGGGTTASTIPDRQRAVIPSVTSRSSSVAAKNRQCRAEPTLRPVLPIRCRKDATDGRGIDLNDPIKVADVETQFEGAGGDNDAVAFIDKGCLGLSALVH
jgi:hypothetical protein